MKKLILLIIVLIAVGAGVGAYYIRRGGPEPQVTTQALASGDIVDTVGATGALEAVTTVQVGTQVSGTVAALYADFNSIVHKGQVVAKLDPSLIQTQIEQNKANVIRSQAEVDRLQVSLEDANTKLKRAQELSARSLIPQSELETAQVTVRSTQAQIKSAEAALTQAKANLNQQQVNLEHTIITAPIDGIVISRSVDVGQTVAASMQAPTLFVIAADLTKMQVNANIDESDVGRIRPGQVVRFRVDAYPTEEFTGSVQQVRLQPQVVQNVVTYNTVIAVPNQQLKLKPGMTANVNIEIARRTNVLRVPNAALRFRPTADMFAALNQPQPPEMQRGMNGRSGRGGNGRMAASGSAGQAGDTASPAGASRGGGDNPATTDADRQERRKRFMERMQNATPEEREQMMARFRARQNGGGDAAGAPAGGAPSRIATSNASTIDSLFGPLPPVETFGRVWLFINKQLKPVRLRLGISDGTWTEILNPQELQPGTEVVTSVVLGTETAARPNNTPNNPLMGPQRGRRGR